MLRAALCLVALAALISTRSGFRCFGIPSPLRGAVPDVFAPSAQQSAGTVRRPDFRPAARMQPATLAAEPPARTAASRPDLRKALGPFPEALVAAFASVVVNACSRTTKTGSVETRMTRKAADVSHPMRRALIAGVAAAAAALPLRTVAVSQRVADEIAEELRRRGVSQRVADKMAEDLQRRAEEVRKDVAYPPAILGEWECARAVQTVEGDATEAEAAWRALGGAGDFRRAERYRTRFVPIPDARRRAGVADRGYEYSARSGLDSVSWSSEQPDVLRVTIRGSRTELVVESRDVEAMQQEPPFAFGFSETVTIRSIGTATRFARLSRRLTPSDDGAIDATERVATFASLDDACENVRPLSATTSQLRLTRPRG